MTTTEHVTQPCADDDHWPCAGFVASPRWPCTCDCHPEQFGREQYAFLIINQHMRQAQELFKHRATPNEVAHRLLDDLRDGGVLGDTWPPEPTS